MASLSGSRLRSLVGGSTVQGNEFGLGAAVVGLIIGWILATLLIDIWPRSGGIHHPLSTFSQDLCSLCGLWLGLIGAAVGATYSHRLQQSRTESARHFDVSFWREFRNDYGIAIVAIDLPIGILVGVFGQYVLSFILELPLLPFVPHLFHRPSQPANNLTKGISGARFIILGLFVCVGSPLVEELYFRGLLLRGLLGKTQQLGATASVLISVVLSGVIFGLVHFEPLELLALAGFGMMLSLLAWSTGRLGPGFIAHVTFNATTFITLAHSH